MKTRILTAMALLLMVTSCDEWTEMKSIEIRKPSMENSPEMYAAYCGVIRDYKASEHKIMYVEFDNVEQFTDRSCHLESLPDSVDFVEIRTPESAAAVSDQMDRLRTEKSFGFTLAISADKIDADYEEAAAAAEEGGQPDPDKAAFIYDAVKKIFGYADKFSFDGVRVQYSGYSTSHLTDEELAQYEAEQEMFFSIILDELKSRPGMRLFLNAKPEFIVSTAILDAADYVILPTEKSTGTGDLALAAIRAGEVVPDAKLLYAVTTITDDFQTGWLSSGEQIPLVSEWMMKSAGYSKCGMVVYDARRAFYDSNRNIYRRLRGAIRNMNPNS